MGGRGSSSLGSKSRTKAKMTQSKIEGAKNYNELKDVIQSEYGITLGKGTSVTNLDELKSTVKNIMDFANEFGVDPNELSPSITATSSKSSWLARVGFNDGIELNNSHYRNFEIEQLNKSYEKLVAEGHLPKGTTLNNVSDYVLGRRLEALIIKKENPNDPTYQKIRWDVHSVSSNIVGNALVTLYAKNDGYSLYGSNFQKFNKDTIEKLSRYATKNTSATLASAVADYRANGKNANELSLEIVKGIKERLKK